MAHEFCLKIPDFHLTFRDILHAVNLRHETHGFTSPPKEGVLRIFFALKNPTASVEFEPANLGSKGQHATSRPPKPLPFPLAHYCGIGDLQSVASATLTLWWMIQKVQMKRLQQTRFFFSEMWCVGLHCRSNQIGLCQRLPIIFGSLFICPRM